MILAHNGKKPVIDPDIYVAPNATVCGDVRIGRGSELELNFPQIVCGVERAAAGKTNMPEITRKRSKVLADHIADVVLFL